jgi:hypothetical protein
MLVKCVIKDTLLHLTTENVKSEKITREDWLQLQQEDRTTYTSLT